MHAIDVQELVRVYAAGRRRGSAKSDVIALDKVSLQVAEGTVHGLLGPNGAGKTTLVRILCTLLLPTAGRASVAGHDVVRDAAAVRRAIGVAFGGERGLYYRLSGRLNLSYWAALYGLHGAARRDRVDRLLDRMGLRERADDPTQTYSRGMMQRLHLARALVGDPRVIFLDEPTNGLDPVAARDLRGLIIELRGEGRTVMLATHDMAEAAQLCDEVTFIDRGRILGTAPPSQVGSWLSSYERIEAQGPVSPGLVAALRAIPGVISVTEKAQGKLVVEVDDPAAMSPALRQLVDSGVTSIRTSTPSLEEVYVHVMGARGLAL